MKISLVFVCFFIVAVQDALSASVHESNTYMDSVLTNYLLPELRSVDPKTLPNFSSSFKTSTLRVNVKANYTRGELRGLSSIKRNGDCKAPYWSASGTASLNCTLNFGKLETKYDLKGKYGILPSVSDASVDAKLKDTDLWVEVSSSQQRNFPQIRIFDVRSLGKLDVDFHGLSTLNTAESSLKRDFSEHMTPLLRDAISSDIRNKLSEAVSKLTMPFP